MSISRPKGKAEKFEGTQIVDVGITERQQRRSLKSLKFGGLDQDWGTVVVRTLVVIYRTSVSWSDVGREGPIYIRNVDIITLK